MEDVKRKRKEGNKGIAIKTESVCGMIQVEACKEEIKAEETFGFMLLLTFVGGYSNAYSYFTRGGAFVSFHTGNMAKLGIAAVTGDSTMFLACVVPICGGLLGAVLAQLVKTYLSRQSMLFWQKTVLIIELTALLIVGFLPLSVPDNAVNFFLSIVLMFQLSNFRKYEGNVHNSTIETGNLRTFGQYCGDILIKRNLASARKAVTYFVMVFSFPLGTLAGGFFSLWTGRSAIWICCILLAVLAFGYLPKTESAK